MSFNALNSKLNDHGYQIGEEIGRGKFGVVYKCTKENIVYAVKCEFRDTKSERRRNEYLKDEFSLYQTYLKNIRCVPGVYHFFSRSRVNFLIMQLLGPDLKVLYDRNKFSEDTILLCFHTMISVLEEVHNCGLIYQDLKPDNILVALDPKDEQKLYLTDFGLSKLYLDSNNNHIAYRSNGIVIGTPRYMSLNAHKKIELSRRDDLESLAYVFASFLHDPLPWQGLVNRTENKNRNISINALILPIKKQHRFEIFDSNHTNLTTYMKCVTDLKFEEEPNYELLRQLVLCNKKYENLQYDWLKVDTSLERKPNFMTAKKKKKKRRIFSCCT